MGLNQFQEVKKTWWNGFAGWIKAGDLKTIQWMNLGSNRGKIPLVSPLTLWVSGLFSHHPRLGIEQMVGHAVLCCADSDTGESVAGNHAWRECYLQRDFLRCWPMP